MTIKALYPTVEPSLNLDFANTKRLDPRITFTRASTATFVGDNGLIQSAAVNAARFDHNPATGESLGLLVEEARTNLAYGRVIAYSQEGWTGVFPNNGLAPDNTFTAVRLTWTSPAGGYIRSSFNTIIANGYYTSSIFIKPNESVSSSFIQVGSIDSAKVARAFFSHNTKTITSTISTNAIITNVSSSLTPFPNGWYKLTVSAFVNDYTQLGFGNVLSLVYASDNTNPNNGDVLVSSPQLEAGAFPTSYIPTPDTFTGRTSTATFYDSAGTVQTAASGVARSAAFFPDENGIFRPAGLLLEAAGTNLLNHSQTFATSGGTQNDWTDTNITRDGTLRTSPDGTANALRITASAANATVISSSGIGTSAARSLSVFLRRVTGSGAVEYTLDNGSTYTPQAISSSWVRYAFPATTADQQVGIRLVTSGNAIELWGAQLEAGASATSYIATTTTTATRAADTSTSATVTRAADVASITGANFSSVFDVTGGTIVAEYYKRAPQQGNGNYVWSLGSTAPAFYYSNAGGYLELDFAAGLGTATGTALSGKNKSAFKFQQGNYAASVNGGTVFTSFNVSSWTTPTSLLIGSGFGVAFGAARLSGPLARLAYYPVRLPDAQLQTLTAS
jgi:hypothetical protein